MHRNSLMDISGRSMLQAVRMKLGSGMKINDNPMMQELDFGGMLQEGRKLVERIQGFGNSSVPLPPIAKKAIAAAGGGASTFGVEAQAAGGGGGGGSASGGGSEEEAPEGIAVFLGGQRNHPVVVAVDDRRHRPMGMKPGESSQYDDAGQMTLIRRNATYVLSCDSEDQDGNKPERMASLRHVEKQKQQRSAEEPAATQRRLGRKLTFVEMRQAMARKAASDQQKQNFKHEGDTVNTEVRVTKKRIEFREGENVKGYHDKNSNHWQFDSQTHTENSQTHNINASNNVNIGNKQVNISGSTGVAITGPTSINGSPAATMRDVVPIETYAALERRVQALEARIIEMGGG